MRIAFDLDDTLIPPRSYPQPLERMPLPLRFYYREGLRPGTRELLREVQSQGHELWIYTTSYRSPFYLKTWFRLLGVRFSGVVNQAKHRQIVPKLRTPGHSASKYPPAFDIDLLIDDSSGVAQEGRRYGFRVIRVDPLDLTWTESILAEIESSD